MALPQTLHPNCAQARTRDVALHLQHPGMQRRARNSSCANRRERRLRWHVEWRFPAAGFTAADKCACIAWVERTTRLPGPCNCPSLFAWQS